MIRKVMVPLLALGVSIAAASAHATPFVIGGASYAPSGTSEALDAAFTTPDAGVTTNSYHGMVEVTVSGIGQSLGADFNDAFYVFSPFCCGVDGAFYQVVVDNAPLVPFNGAQDGRNFIVYDVDANVEAPSRPYLPAYRPNDHTYTFIIDTSLFGVIGSDQLHFGVSDGIFADNSGKYTVQVTQLDPVPEPATLTLLGTALAGLGARRLRARRQQQQS